MTDDEHIAAGRIFEFVRSGTPPDKHEVEHLKNCAQCREVAMTYRRWNSHMEPDGNGKLELPHHVRPRRIWQFIHSGAELSDAERGHIAQCAPCQQVFKICLTAELSGDSDDRGMGQSA